MSKKIPDEQWPDVPETEEQEEHVEDQTDEEIAETETEENATWEDVLEVLRQISSRINDTNDTLDGIKDQLDSVLDNQNEASEQRQLLRSAIAERWPVQPTREEQASSLAETFMKEDRKTSTKKGVKKRQR